MGELQEIQKAFTEHLRNPDHVPVPLGLDERRVGIYSELIFNNVSALLADFFPVIHSILSEDRWDRMVRDFFVSHQSQTPYFMELSGEFAEYLAQSQLLGDYPDFLPELAHYEWIELSLYTLDENPPAEVIEPQLIADTPLQLSPLALPLAYQYPVHRIRPEFQPGEPGTEPVYLLVLRDAEEKVRFFELQLLSFQLLHEIQRKPGLIARDWLENVADQINLHDKSVDKDEFIRNGSTLLQSFNEHRIFIEE
ncbi:MAG: DUF2063 domain-containing protein [Gammaproteobacteria bacterium]|jgi:uncharacterized protein|nr:DUF2063 domain-containing protein [Gammaproteobacteria bacterium]MBT4494182.1 DUF2063 domain-containing protein [Gammaproteobacteria bacterium]MBT7370794.1 DUF2063 domain-containing protein [Gammaproteobacteria bacterium]